MQPLCTASQRTNSSASRGPAVVLLNIYDLGKSHGIQVLNSMLSALDTGAFHCGVEVHGREFSYEGGIGPGSGIFSCPPKICPGHTFHQSIVMGEIMLTVDEVFALVALLELHWPAKAYHMLKKNCCHFCETFCLCLGVGPVPSKIKSLASAVERVETNRRFLEASMARQVERCSICCTRSSPVGRAAGCCYTSKVCTRRKGRRNCHSVHGRGMHEDARNALADSSLFSSCHGDVGSVLCPDCNNHNHSHFANGDYDAAVHPVDFILPDDARNVMYGYSDDEDQIIDLDPGELGCETRCPYAAADRSMPMTPRSMPMAPMFMGRGGEGRLKENVG